MGRTSGDVRSCIAAPTPFLAKVYGDYRGGYPGFPASCEAYATSTFRTTVAGQRRTLTGFPHCRPCFRASGDPCVFRYSVVVPRVYHRPLQVSTGRVVGNGGRGSGVRG